MAAGDRPAGTREAFDTVEHAAQLALDGMRRLLGLLREDGDVALAPPPSLARLPELIDQVAEAGLRAELVIEGEPYEVSERFGIGQKLSPFLSAGVMLRREVWTRKVIADHSGPSELLSSVLLPDSEVPDEFFIAPERLGDIENPKQGTWRYLKFSRMWSGTRIRPATAIAS